MICDPLKETAPQIPADRLPLLITGITGVPGYNAFFHFRERYGEQVIGQRPNVNWRLQGPGIEACDLENPGEIRRLFGKYGFRSVLNCGGSCALKSCELDPAMARRVNVAGVESLLRQIAGQPVRLVHLSIDLVFSGNRSGGYVETDKPDPVTIYGKTMWEAERLIETVRPSACVLRISLPMGVSFNGHAGAIDWIQARFRKGFPATLYFDEVRTPTYVECMNALYEHFLCTDQRGIYHAGGPRRLTLFEIAQIVNRVGGYDPRLLNGCYRIQAGPVPPRAGNVSLNSEKLRAELGFDPFCRWPLREEHVPIHRNWHYERDPSLRSGPGVLSEALYRRPAD
jgi:dTDP-4-dehydrorhamnose reductase